MSARLKDFYNEQIIDAMTKKFGYKNIMEVPKLDKIVINMGVGEAKDNAKVLENAVKDMETIPDRRQFLPKLRIQLLTSRFVKVWQSVVRPLFVVRKCTNSLIV